MLLQLNVLTVDNPNLFTFDIWEDPNQIFLWENSEQKTS